MIRTIRFDATYEDGAEMTRTVDLDVPDGLDPEALTELLYKHTGFGRTADFGERTLDAYYAATSVDGFDPDIKEEWC